MISYKLSGSTQSVEGRMASTSIALLLVLQMTSADLLRGDDNAHLVTIESCGEGTYLRKTECETCSKCADFEYVRTKCNSTHNTRCECMPAYYRDGTDGQCKSCTACPVGWGASPACTSTSNTVCVVCPKDSYSSIESSTKSCQSCTLCDQRNEYILTACSSKQDTTCFKVKQQTSSVDETLTRTTCRDGDCAVQKDNSYLYTAPLYCAVLGAIIVGLLIYVVLRCRVNKKRSVYLASTGCSKQPLNHNIMQQQQQPCHATLPQAPAGTAIVYLNNGGKTVTVSSKYVELPTSVRRTVARSLSQDGSWLQLAHCLGFTPSEISQIQQKAEQNYKRSSTGSILMSEWTKRDFSSVGVIVHALASINRLDLVTLIHSSNSMKGSEIV